MELEEIVSVIRLNPELKSVPQEQLEWLVRESQLQKIEKDKLYFTPGYVSEEMIILLKGRIRIYSIQNGQERELFILEPGSVSGQMPYSRMKAAPVYSKAMEDVELLLLHQSKFDQLICGNPELAAAIVHLLFDRIRAFTTSHFQNEKLLSLGKLSAGLAHELNNPAAAISRSADALRKQIGSLPANFKEITSFNLDKKQVEVVNRMLTQKRDAGAINRMSALERGDKEEEMGDLLRSFQIENADEIAESFVEYGFTTEELEELAQYIPAGCLSPVLNWLNTNLLTEKLAAEITTASKRINDLVSSIRNYSYMDRNADKQPVNVNEGIRNTLTMLQHKVRKHNVHLDETLDETLPEIKGFPGALNQLWTNLIDNALDAMEQDGGKLQVSSSLDNNLVVVEITDTGSGIPTDIMDKIFDPFFTTKDVGKGTGIGLEIVKRIIEMHKGSYKISSKVKDKNEVGHGTRFRIILPVDS